MKYGSVSSMLKAVVRVDFSIINANRKEKIKSCQYLFYLNGEGEVKSKENSYRLNVKRNPCRGKSTNTGKKIITPPINFSSDSEKLRNLIFLSVKSKPCV